VNSRTLLDLTPHPTPPFSRKKEKKRKKEKEKAI
jgi:hypothetical protein